MSRDAVIESWLASMSESELIDQCFFWHDMALEHGRMYNAIKAENAKLRDSLKALIMGTYAELCADRDQPQCKECAMRRGDESCVVADALNELGIELNDYE